MKTRKSAIVVISFVGFFMFACLAAMVLLLVFRPDIKPEVITNAFGGAMLTALGYMGGVLSHTGEGPPPGSATVVQGDPASGGMIATATAKAE